MSEQFTVARLRESQLDSAADLMNRVFFEQLRAAALAPSAEQQLKYHEGYLNVVRFWFAHGQPYAAECEGRVVGLALWMPPHTLDRAEEERQEFGTDQLQDIFRDSLSHLYRLSTLLGELRRKYMKGKPHWFLPSRLDVDPAFYGKGVASALMEPVLKRADEGQVYCYLETILDFMVPFFKRQGFEVLEEGMEPMRGVRYWVMCREPQAIE